MPPFSLEEDDRLASLIGRIQQGVQRDEACEILFRRFRPRVTAFFMVKGFSPEESRDLAQDVFLRVFKGIDTFRRDSRFERWLWEISNNIYLDEVRSRKREKRDAVVRSLDVGYEDGPGLTRELAAEELTPEDEVIRRQNLDLLRVALRELPDQMRRCCLLRYEAGLKYNEIADRMNISIETVKAHLHQARKRLLHRLAGSGGMGRSQE